MNNTSPQLNFKVTFFKSLRTRAGRLLVRQSRYSDENNRSEEMTQAESSKRQIDDHL